MKRKKNTPLSSEEKLKKGRMIDKKIVLDATLQSLVKLNPKTQIKNPVMFVVYLGAILTTVLFFLSLGGIKDGGSWYIFAISLILWFTSLFGNFAEAAQLSSIADETAEGRSIVVLAKNKFGLRGKEIASLKAEFIEFSAKTRMSGIDVGGEHIRKGSADAVEAYVRSQGGVYPKECAEAVKRVANEGGTPLVVARGDKVLGVIYLKDIVKEGVSEKFEDLRKIGIKTIMITGDNPMTAAAIAAEAGVDDFVAEATPETKLALIKKLQAEGHLVAMTGDGTNDAPALAQADVAVAMNSGTQAAKEAGNMVDLDSSPTKLIEVVRIGKQLLMTRGALTTFSIANDIAKYFAIIPVLFAGIYPGLDALNFMRLSNPATAILSSIIYNALIIIALIPLSLKGVRSKEQPAGKMLKNNLLIYGAGGVIAPFVFIKLFDLLLAACGVA